MGLVLCLFVLAGCATPYRTALQPGVSLEDANASIVLATDQEEIGTTINPSMIGVTAVGGLIGSLIDSGVNATSAGRMKRYSEELRSNLPREEVERLIADGFAAKASISPRAPVPPVVVLHDRDRNELAGVVDANDGDAVLVAFTYYALSPDFSQIAVNADILICAKSEELKKRGVMQSFGGWKVSVLYRNRIQSAWSISGLIFPKAKGREELAELWVADDCAHAKMSLIQAAGEMGALLCWDLGQPPAENYKSKSAYKRETPVYRRGGAVSMQCSVLLTEDGRRWLRLVDGGLAAEPI